jgi:hypothetical protein
MERTAGSLNGILQQEPQHESPEKVSKIRLVPNSDDAQGIRRPRGQGRARWVFCPRTRKLSNFDRILDTFVFSDVRNIGV